MAAVYDSQNFPKTRIGLLPASARKGDVVGLFAGSDVLLIHRRFAGQWRLIGRSYVHGIMHGEVYEENACKEYSLL